MTTIESKLADLEGTQEHITPWALENLPPFPGVALQLLQLLAKEDIHIREVGRFIAADPVFAADVLQIANSALFGLRSQVKTIAHAVMVLGLERVKAVSLTRAFGMYLTPVMRVEAVRRCWQNSLAGALLAEKLADCCGIDVPLAYTAGLLRDIGRFALLVKYPGPYANMLAVSQDNGYDLMSTERELFDVDHCQAGAWLTQKMKLPEELREVAAGHHLPVNGGPFGLVQLVHVADAMSDCLGFGILPEPPDADLARALEVLPAAARARLDDDPEKLKKEINERILLLSRN